MQSQEFIQSRRQLAHEVLEVLRRRDSVDAQFWTYSVHESASRGVSLAEIERSGIGGLRSAAPPC